MSEKPEARKILTVKDISVSFDGFKVLDQLNFSLNYQELRFLIGPNGAGKTTLLDIITGKTRPSHGQVIFDGADGPLNILHWPEHKLVQYGIARKFQTPAVFPSLSVYENMEAAAGFKDSMRALLGHLTPLQRVRVDQTLEMIRLKDRADLRAGSLSHGQKQWLEIGMLLVQEPKLLLLDEPVAGMTRHERDRTGELLQAIQQKCAILVVEHDMQFMRQFASTVTILHQGQLLVEGSVEAVQNDPRVIEVYLGHSHRQAEAA
ncbi:MAG TPA: urea ABC transporter ATP-binding protein UrtD [Aggregatilineales bacterium]|nr:urea ABC transporter ATP-binding protein UrtD [Aggregatilineales bacterium]